MNEAGFEDLPRLAELAAEYEILRVLGRGGTAVVYLARERELGRHVAIKVIRAAHVEDEEAVGRLVREARTVSALQHPNIVVLYGTRRLRDGSIALIMQYVPGRTLKEEIAATGPLPFPRVRQILGDVGRALACAHRHRIVHRDVKPENIYLDTATGAARLSDFGIARPWDTDSGLTLPGSAIGTPAYMSPEQIDGAPLDGRSDLYSLGMIGYEMLTGTRPWAGENLYGIIYRQKREELPPLDTVRPGTAPQLRRALEGTFGKTPEERWPDAERFLDALGESRLAGGGFDAGPAAAPSQAAGAWTAALPDNATVQFRRDTLPGPLVAPVPAAPAAPTAPQQPQQRQHADDRDRGTARGALVVAALTIVIVTLIAASLQWTSSETAPAAVSDTAAPAAEPAPAPVPHLPAAVHVVGGTDQSGAAGDTLPQPLEVRVEDADGNPVAGVGVRFRIAAGEGTLAPYVTVTDRAGTARTRWLPLAAGAHRVETEVNDIQERLVFTAVATAAGPPTLVAQPADAAVSDARTVAVRVEDGAGRPAAGVRVRFAVVQGGGRVQPATAVSDDSGIAQAMWQPGTAGVQEASARIDDVPNSTVRFSAGDAGPAPLPVRAGLVAGGTHGCALAADGTLACWGGNDRGQLGDGSTARREAPVAVAAPEALAGVAAGVSHTCAVGTSGTAYCWGENAAGQLGNGGSATSRRPVRVALDPRLTRVAAGLAHTCALAESGALYCWGGNDRGQLGDGSRTGRSTPVRAGGSMRFRSFAVGWSHTCGLAADGGAFCWGRNDSGQLGDGGTTDRAAPVAVAGGHHFAALAAGSAHTCGVRADGAVLCWGQNTHGQLGTGTATSSPAPVAAAADGPFSAVAVGALHSCALVADGTTLCWGRNNYGQLGDGTTQDRARPVAVLGPAFGSIVANGAHSCGSAGGRWHCWGFNLEGQLGDGSRTNQVRPNPMSRLR
jgi:alpha-tubulin suppressor-like RCC1 family protein/tRNA A-37 threonylcarbamoyl transferase component Bud32